MAAVRKKTTTKVAEKSAGDDEDVSRPKKAVSRKTVSRTAKPADPSLDGSALVERVARAVERELAQIEGIVGSLKGASKPTDAERRARTLASLARTLGEIRRLRAVGETQRADDEPSAARDLDEFRKVLFQRLEKMAEGRAASADPGDERGGDG